MLIEVMVSSLIFMVVWMGVVDGLVQVGQSLARYRAFSQSLSEARLCFDRSQLGDDRYLAQEGLDVFVQGEGVSLIHLSLPLGKSLSWVVEQ